MAEPFETCQDERSGSEEQSYDEAPSEGEKRGGKRHGRRRESPVRSLSAPPRESPVGVFRVFNAGERSAPTHRLRHLRRRRGDLAEMGW